MNARIFNAALLIGWVNIVIGMAMLCSIGAALVTGGILLLIITLLLARWAGVVDTRAKGHHVP